MKNVCHRLSAFGVDRLGALPWSFPLPNVRQSRLQAFLCALAGGPCHIRFSSPNHCFDTPLKSVRRASRLGWGGDCCQLSFCPGIAISRSVNCYLEENFCLLASILLPLSASCCWFGLLLSPLVLRLFSLSAFAFLLIAVGVWWSKGVQFWDKNWDATWNEDNTFWKGLFLIRIDLADWIRICVFGCV